ncbi:MAG: response regulator transcription factor, partial [Phycisphaerales bacterium]
MCANEDLIALRRPHKVLVVEDHPIVRQGLSELIEHESDLSVCGAVPSKSEALEVVGRSHPDIAIVDLSLQDTSGLELVKDIKAQFPHLPVLVLSMHDETLYAERALRAGARGYIMKEEATERVMTAIRKVLSGEVYLSEKMSSRLLSNIVSGPAAGESSPVTRLSDRELQVFELIGRGMGTRKIANSLHLSVKTIETHKEHIKSKMQL